MHTPEQPTHQPIRSYVLRQGRVTQAQQLALEKLWPIYGVETRQGIDLNKIFIRPAPVILEIGFGNGDSLAQMAQAAPEKNFLGIEVHRPGVGHLLMKIEEMGLTNLRICSEDAIHILQHTLSDESLAGLQLFFPDPWHKKRHNKRRLVNAAFASLLVRKLVSGGVVHMATDWEEYAQQMLCVLQSTGQLVNLAEHGGYSERPAHRPLTKFERRGQLRGHGVWDILFKKT